MQAQFHLRTKRAAALQEPRRCNGLVALGIDQQQTATPCVVKQVFTAQILNLAQQAGRGRKLQLQQQSAVGAVEFLQLQLSWDLRAALQLLRAAQTPYLLLEQGLESLLPQRCQNGGVIAVSTRDPAERPRNPLNHFTDQQACGVNPAL